MQLRVPTVASLTLFLFACGGTESPEPQGPEQAATTPTEAPTQAPVPFQLSAEQLEGKVVYETMCWSCHGSGGRGDGPAVQAGVVAAPRDFTVGSFSETRIRQLLAEFRAQASSLESGNPHMKNVLSMIDVDAFESAIAYLPALTYPPEIPGSAIAGHQIYLIRCQGCHGAGGRGDGPGAANLNIPPADFSQDTLLASGAFEAAFEKIRSGGGGLHGSAMPAWGIMLVDGEVWDLVAYISTFQPGVLSSPTWEEE
jgi:mono/diheme cytochrome c family protein